MNRPAIVKQKRLDFIYQEDGKSADQMESLLTRSQVILVVVVVVVVVVAGRLYDLGELVFLPLYPGARRREVKNTTHLSFLFSIQ